MRFTKDPYQPKVRYRPVKTWKFKVKVFMFQTIGILCQDTNPDLSGQVRSVNQSSGIQIRIDPVKTIHDKSRSGDLDSVKAISLNECALEHAVHGEVLN